jgi:hypothetical protein
LEWTPKVIHGKGGHFSLRGKCLYGEEGSTKL